MFIERAYTFLSGEIPFNPGPTTHYIVASMLEAESSTVRLLVESFTLGCDLPFSIVSDDSVVSNHSETCYPSSVASVVSNDSETCYPSKLGILRIAHLNCRSILSLKFLQYFLQPSWMF